MAKAAAADCAIKEENSIAVIDEISLFIIIRDDKANKNIEKNNNNGMQLVYTWRIG